MAVQLPNGRNYFATATGAPGVGYRLYTYVPGTSTPKATYTSSSGAIANTNPVVADARGEMAVYWIGSYDVVLRDASDNLIWGPERLEDASGNLEDVLADTSSASNGAGMVGLDYDSTPPEGTVAASLLQRVQVFNYLTDAQKAEARSGSNSLDMSSQVQIALNSGYEIDWGDNRFSYLVTGLTVPITVRAMHGAATIKCQANSTTMMQWLADTSRAATRHMSGGLKLVSNSRTGVTLLKLGSTTNNPSAGAQEAILYFAMRDIEIDGGSPADLNVGLDSEVSMEHTFDNVVLKNAMVGGKFYSDAINGGQNANAYNGLRLQGNSVGAIVKNNYPAYGIAVHNNNWTGLTIQENLICGLAFIGCTAQFVQAGHFEGNGLGASSITIDGTVIPKCDLLVDASHVTVATSDLATSLSPSVIVRNAGRFSTDGLTGYGTSSGDKISCDATSIVYETGATAAIGVVNNLASYGQITTVSGLMATHGAPLANITRGINLYNSNPVFPDTSNVDGVATWGIVKTEFGITPRVTYGASTGSTSTNRLYMALMTCVASTFNISTLLVKPSADCTMTARWLAGASALQKTFSLIGGRWNRLTFVSYNASNHQLYLFPADTLGVTMDVQAVQCTSAGLFEVSNVYQTGAVNTSTELYNRYSAAPTTGTWAVGDVVYNSAPAAAGTLGWVCTTAGTPGTWKTFGAIAA